MTKTNLDNLYDYQPNLAGHYRCTICNCVSNESIETEIGDFRKTSFTQDPKYKDSYICVECSEAIQDVRYDYDLMNEEDE